MKFPFLQNKILRSRYPIFISALLFYFFISSLLFAQAFYGYPLPVGDKEWYYPVIYNLKLTGELSHPFQTGLDSNMWLNFGFAFPHGFLFPRVQNLFNFFNEYHMIQFSSVLLLFLNCLIALHLLNNKYSHWLFIPISISVYIYQMGRPELLVSTILLFDYIIRSKFKLCSIYYEAFISTTLFITSPVSAILHYFFIFAVDRNSENKFHRFSFLYFFISFFTLIISFLILGPDISLLEWIRGLLYQSNSYMSGSELIQTGRILNINEISTYAWNESSIPKVALIFIYFILFFCTSKNLLSLASALVFCVLVYWFAFKSAMHIYNFISFIPLLLLYDQRLFPTFNIKKLFFLKYLYSFLSPLLLIIFSAGCLEVLAKQTVVQTFLNLKYGHPPSSLIKSINAVENNKVIEIPKAFYFADIFSDKVHVKLLQKQDYSKSTLYSGDIVYLSQAGVGVIKQGEIPQIVGYCIVEQLVQYYPIQALYDWSFIKYEKC